MNRKMISAALLSSVLTGALVLAQDKPATPPPAMMNGKTVYEIQASAIGKLEKGTYLGLTTSKAPLARLKQFNIKSGVVVKAVTAGSPAEAAGLKVDDVLEKMEDQILINPVQLEGLIRLHAPGDDVTLSLLRNGSETEATARLIQHDVLAMTDLDLDLGGLGVISVDGNALSGLTKGDQAKIFVDALPPDALAHLSKDDLAKIMGGQMKGDAHAIVRSESISFGGTTAEGTKYKSQFADGKHELTIIQKDGKKVLTVKDSDGHQLFEGPVDTDEDQKAIPADVLPMFHEMQRVEKVRDLRL